MVTIADFPQALEWKRRAQSDGLTGAHSREAWLGALSLEKDEDSPGSPSDNYVPAIRVTHAVLAICLNLGTPQQLRVNHPIEEAWFDPATKHHERSMKSIMSNLCGQLENLQRMTLLSLPDPKQETLYAAISKARRAAKEDHMIFIYNDHGTLAPTEQAEIWVYDTDFPVIPTTYNPIFVSHVVDYAKSGTIYLWDCDNAGILVKSAVEHGRRRDDEYRIQLAHLPSRSDVETTHAECDYHFAACSHHEILPLIGGLPRDVFTSCMISPVLMALRFYHLTDSLRLSHSTSIGLPALSLQDLLDIPGELHDRETPLGELHWCLTAIIENIAWQTLPIKLFRKMFRSNPALAGLSRGFILAQRVMRKYDCTPVSYPDLPSSHLHPLWRAWDCLLDDFLSEVKSIQPPVGPMRSYVYRSPSIMLDLLYAFSAQLRLFTTPSSFSKVPRTRKKVALRCSDNLPIALYALLHSGLRSFALPLLTRYFDLGGIWPVHWAFQCGLDQLQGRLLKLNDERDCVVVVFLFCRMMQDPRGPPLLLSRDRQGSPPAIKTFIDFAKSKLHKSEEFSEALGMIAYLIAIASNTSQEAAVYCEEEGAIGICQALATDEDPLCRQWGIMTLAVMRSAVARDGPIWKSGMDKDLQEIIRATATDRVADVRASALYAMLKLFQVMLRKPASEDSRHVALELTAHVAKSILRDGSGQIRYMFLELSQLALCQWSGIVEIIGWMYATEDQRSPENRAERRQIFNTMESWLTKSGDRRAQEEQRLTFVREIYIALIEFTTDPDPVVSRTSRVLLRSISTKLLRSNLNSAFPECGKDVVGRGQAAVVLLDSLRRPSDRLRDLSQFLVPRQTGSAISNLQPGQSGPEVDIFAAIAARIADEPDDYWSEDVNQDLSGETPHTPDGQGFARHCLPALEEWLEVSSQYFHQPRLLWEDLSDGTIAKHLTLREQSGEDSAIVMAGDLQNGFSHHWFTMQSQEDIGLLVFHSYEPILAIAGEHTIELWHTDDQRRMTSFSPSLVQRSPIKSMAFLNENQELNHFTLMVTLCDGVVRIFHGQSASADGQDQFHATAAFRSMETSHCNSAVVTTWSQARNELSIASGSSSSMQIWDAQQQRCTRTISINRTRLESVLTCLDVEPERGNIFLSGDSAGVVTMYDQRQRRQPAIKFWDDNNNSSVSLCTLGAGLEKEIVSVSLEGTIAVWDLRLPHPLASAKANASANPIVNSACQRNTGITAILAPSSVDQAVDLSVHRLSYPSPVQTTFESLPYHPRKGAVTTPYLAFHPQKSLLGIGLGKALMVRSSNPADL